MPTVSRLQDPEAWEGVGSAEEICADALKQGRLALVLGAGASTGFGLPDWNTLVDRLFLAKGSVRPTGSSPESAAELFRRTYCNNSDTILANEVRDALYKDYSLDLSSLKANNLLASIGALTLASSRGAVSAVVTYNFDTALETYLRAFGLVVESVAQVPCWASRADLRILHPHGLLRPDEPATHGVVLTMADFDRVVGDGRDAWRRAVLEALASRTCLFVGISGEDSNLRSIMMELKETHAATRESLPYWGYSTGKRPRPNAHIWHERGVCPLEFDEYEEIPAFLLRICQRAAMR